MITGVQIHFDAIEIVPEKDVATYRELVNRHHVVKSRGWMVGNSPAAISIPRLVKPECRVHSYHPLPGRWNTKVRSGAGRLLILTSFRDMPNISDSHSQND